MLLGPLVQRPLTVLLRKPIVSNLPRFSSRALMSSSALEKVLATSVAAADRAGDLVRSIMKGGDLKIVEKTGVNDLQTAADRAANDAILASLQRGFPGLTVIGEEGCEVQDVDEQWTVGKQDALKVPLPKSLPDKLKAATLEDMTVWVDPLDGTKEYTEGFLDHVTVLIGIAVGKEAVAGVIHQPFFGYEKGDDASLGRTFWGVVGVGTGGALTKATAPPADKKIVTTTRSHSNTLIQGAMDAIKPDEILRVGGSGHKVILLLEGLAHAYVFPSPGCKKWDTCGPEAILHALGGKMTDMRGVRYDYDKDATVPDEWGVLATARAEDHACYLDVVPKDVTERIKDYYKKKK